MQMCGTALFIERTDDLKSTKSFTQNTVILFISMIISKIVGALFKIPLTNIIGGIGMGYYSTAYSLYTPIFAVTAAAVPTVIVKVTAQCAAVREYAGIKKTLKTALITFGLIGFAGTVIILMLAFPFAKYVAQSPESALSIIMISPSVILCCISSVFKGYYEGLCNMAPTAFSQVAESVSRAVFGLTASLLAVKYGMDCYSAGGVVYGIAVQSEEEALHAIFPYAAAGAVAAVTLSELTAAVCLIIRYKFGKKDFIYVGTEKTESFRHIAKNLIKECIPIALGAVAVNLSSFIDLITIPRCISYTVSANSGYFTAVFGDIIHSQGGVLKLSNFIYGSYTGVAGTMFMLIPAFTGMLGRSALPELAMAWSVKNKRLFNRKLSVVLRSNFIIGFPLYLGMAALSQEILTLLYSNRPDEAAISALPLFILSIGGVFLTLSATFFSVFQIIGRPDLPVKLMLAGAAVKLIFNIFLITIPNVNICGAAISTVISHAFTALGGYLALENVTGDDFNIFRLLFSPLFSGVVCAVSSFAAIKYIDFSDSLIINLLFSVLIGGFVYGISLIFTGGINIKYLKNRQKIIK